MQIALRGHDWAHRWAEVFEQVGLEVPIGLRARLDQMEGMAAALNAT